MKESTLLYYHIHNDVVAFSTTRHGGVGTGNYSSFNINRYCGDTDDAIKENRRLLCRLLKIDDDRLIMPHQVHLTKTVCINEAFLACSEEERRERLEGVDAIMTNLYGVCIGVSTADCIPVLIYDSRRKVAAASRLAMKSMTHLQARGSRWKPSVSARRNGISTCQSVIACSSLRLASPQRTSTWPTSAP